MIALLAVAVAMSATFTVQPVTILPVSPVGIVYGAGSITMTRGSGRVVCDAVVRGAVAPLTFRWQIPGQSQVEFTKTVTARSGNQLSGDSRLDVGPGYYSVWVYDATGRTPLGYGCLVVPTP